MSRPAGAVASSRASQGYILIVDDDAGFRAFVTALLAQAGYLTRQASSGDEALRTARSECPDLVVLDICLPGVSGYEICRELKDQLTRALPILFVSGIRTEPFDRAAGLLVGGDDYLCKPFAPDEFLARVRRLARGTAGENESPDFALTGREHEVLQLLATDLSTADIARELTISPRTVATHTEHIFQKLQAHTRAHAVSRGYETGLLEVLNG